MYICKNKKMAQYLTITEIEALQILKDELSIPKYSTKAGILTMRSLYHKGLVKLTRYKSGEFWELSEKQTNIT